MKELLSLLCDCLKQQKTVVMATVIHQEGSTPRGAGSKMLVDSTGLISGTIGGGLAEAESIKACAKVLQSQKPMIMHFSLTGEMAAKSEMICGGLLHIFIEPIIASEQNIIFFQTLLNHLESHEVHVLTQLDDNQNLQRHLCIDGIWQTQEQGTSQTDVSDIVKNSLLSLTSSQKHTAYIQEQQGYIIEKYPPVWQVIIAGGGHVSLFTTKAAKMAGFDVIVLDDRAEFSQHSRFPEAKSTFTVPDFEQCFALCPPTKYTCIVIVTRGHLHDKTVLAQSLNTKASYIGMIGSKRKRAQVYDALLKEGFSEDSLKQVFCPIGLAIKAETPEEIAISIVAQCIAHRRQAWEILQA